MTSSMNNPFFVNNLLQFVTFAQFSSGIAVAIWIMTTSRIAFPWSTTMQMEGMQTNHHHHHRHHDGHHCRHHHSLEVWQFKWKVCKQMRWHQVWQETIWNHQEIWKHRKLWAWQKINCNGQKKCQKINWIRQKNKKMIVKGETGHSQWQPKNLETSRWWTWWVVFSNIFFYFFIYLFFFSVMDLVSTFVLS